MLFQGEPADVLAYVGYSISHCGYCDQEETSHTFGVWAFSLSALTYQKLLDRGFRRSGSYLYRPNLRRSCCKQYTIRLDANAFRPDKAQRQALRKLNKFVLGDSLVEELSSGRSKKTKKSCCFDLQATLDLPLYAGAKPDHRLEIDLEPSSFTEEKFELFLKYQVGVHKDRPEDVSVTGFKRFLCDTPIHPDLDGIPLQNTEVYGSFHQTYRIDGKLIALAVLDFLPGCISSVYFAYDPAFSHLSLGRVSACREAAMSRYRVDGKQIYGGQYYMGYYIPNCVKMKYKGEYCPSYLRDPCVAGSLSSPSIPTCAAMHDAYWNPLDDFQKLWREREKAAGSDEKPDYFVSFVPEHRHDSSLPAKFTDRRVKGNALPPGTLAHSQFQGLFAIPIPLDGSDGGLKLFSHVKVLSRRGVVYASDVPNFPNQSVGKIGEMMQIMGPDIFERAIVDPQ